MDTKAIRERAEQMAADRIVDESVPREDLEALVHELQVHQIELELQNEELLQLQTKLKVSERKYFDLYNLAPVGYLSLDHEGHIVQINLTGSEMFGRTRNVLTGSLMISFLGGPSGQGFLEHVRSVFQDKGPQQVELTLSRPNGSQLVVLAESALVRDKHQSLCYMTLTDIDERKKMEQTLEEQKQELQRSNRDLEQFAYVVAHDLQEPLRMIISFAELLRESLDGKLDESTEEFFNIVIGNTSLLRTMVRGLLEYSRLNNKDIDVGQKVDMKEVVEQAQAQLALKVFETDAIFTVQHMPLVVGNPTLLLHLVQNLLSNSIKFRGEESPQVLVEAQKHNGDWVFSVKDNGIGIDPAFSEKIFEVFRRLHIRSEYPGVGIGLALCRRVVDLHGGKIWVESLPGKGATFFFTLPAVV